MPELQQLLKAQLQEISWDENQQVVDAGQPVPVQFNPESLKVGYTNQTAGGDQRGGSAIQFVGQGTTKLSFDLWFDVTAGEPDQPVGGENDVRRLTEKVVAFIRPKSSAEADKFIPPGVRFLWGTFLFEGVVDSINESLEFFSEDGRPLRAKIGLSLSKQDIQFQFGEQAGSFGGGASPQSSPPQAARQGDTVQSVAARSGRQDDWQDIASANDIDNPRNLTAGQPLEI